MILLYVLISNCSRESLYLCGERRIVMISLSVGRGIGPEIFAPLFFIVSTMREAASSTSREDFVLLCQHVRVYRGFEQNKKHSFSSRAFSRKAPVSRKGRALTLSTEIICRSGFFFGFAVTSRVSPIHRIFTQRIYITKSASGCQAFMQDFRNFFEIFFVL